MEWGWKLKVFDGPGGKDAVVEEVQQVVAKWPGVSVEDQFFGFPCVFIPQALGWEQCKAIKQALIDAGYQPY